MSDPFPHNDQDVQQLLQMGFNQTNELLIYVLAYTGTAPIVLICQPGYGSLTKSPFEVSEWTLEGPDPFEKRVGLSLAGLWAPRDQDDVQFLISFFSTCPK